MDEKAFEFRMDAIEKQVENINRKRETIYERLNKIELGNAKMTATVENMFTILGEIKAKVDELTLKPAKKSEQYFSYIINTGLALL